MTILHNKQYWDDNDITHKITFIDLDKDKINIIGSFELSDYFETDSLRLNGFYVQPEYRGQGYGNSMLIHLFKIISDDDRLKSKINNLYLEVREDNIIAINLYEKFNFNFGDFENRENYKWMQFKIKMNS